jgi:hypothetical protein
VTEVRQKAKLALVALAGAAVGVALARLRRPTEAPAEAPDDRAEELRRKLAEARAAFADEDDFEAAGMGAETVVEEPPPAAGTPEPQAEPPPKPTPKPAPPKPPTEPPRDEFEAMRRRIHEEGKAAAEEMRRSADTPDQP